MSTEKSGSDLERDVRAIREKYNAFAEAYAENRSEAAEMAGKDADSRHWASVAKIVSEGEDR